MNREQKRWWDERNGWLWMKMRICNRQVRRPGRRRKRRKRIDKSEEKVKRGENYIESYLRETNIKSIIRKDKKTKKTKKKQRKGRKKWEGSRDNKIINREELKKSEKYITQRNQTQQ